MNTDHPSDYDAFFIRCAIMIACSYCKYNEIPVGAVLVSPKGMIVALYKNCTRRTVDPTAHAEIMCIRTASQLVNQWRLNGYRLYTSLEPCPMCLWAANTARIKEIVWAQQDHRQGAVSGPTKCCPDKHAIHKIQTRQLYVKEAACILPNFFKKMRSSCV